MQCRRIDDYDAQEIFEVTGDKGVSSLGVGGEWWSGYDNFKGMKSEVQIYSDMSLRDLLQTRVTDELGNSSWKNSPVIEAAVNGETVVLDGVEKMKSFNEFNTFWCEGNVQLPSGEVCKPLEEYERLKGEGVDVSKVLPVHPNFKVIALGNVENWSEPVEYIKGLRGFETEAVRDLGDDDVRIILKGKFKNLSETDINTIMVIQNDVKNNDDFEDFTLRNIVNIAKSVNEGAGIAESVGKVMLTELWSLRDKEELRGLLENVGVFEEEGRSKVYKSPTRQPPTDPSLIPNPTFYPIPNHMRLIKDLLHSLATSSPHLLLIGNQGVGKNKIADQLCKQISAEREYIQLHRDSTVNQLTVSPEIISGKIIFSDSPLVKAIKHGRILMIDEADKAPVEVVGILKGLIEDGVMRLSDGRTIVPNNFQGESDNIIRTHEDFVMMLLANRPGYPFLGNDFYETVGDCLTTFFVRNPDEESEMKLLESYAPTVGKDILQKLVSSFATLRKLSDNGELTYPYSTREAVAAAVHYEKYKEDGIVRALDNVLDYDSYDEVVFEKVAEVFRSQGIPVPKARGEYLKAEDVNMAISPFQSLREAVETSWKNKPISTVKSSNAVASLEQRKWNLPDPTVTNFQPDSHRIDQFTHLVRSFDGKPGGPYSKAVGMTVNSKNGDINVLTTGPVSISTYSNVAKGSSAKTTHDIEENVPFYLPTQPAPIMKALGTSNFVFFPGGPMYFQMFEDGSVRYAAVPDAGSGGGGFSRMFGGQKAPTRLDTGLPWEIVVCSKDKVLCFQQNGRDVCSLDLKNHECSWVELPEGSEIETLSASSNKDAFATLADGTVVKIQDAGSATKMEVRGVPEGMKGMRVLSAEHPPAHLAHDPSCRLIAGDDMAYATSLGSSLVGDDLYVTLREEGSEVGAVGSSCFSGKLMATYRSNDDKHWIEVIDTEDHEMRSIDFDTTEAGEPIQMNFMDDEHISVLTSDGQVQILEVGPGLEAELVRFREMLGLPGRAVPDGEGMRSLTQGPELRDGTEGESWRPPALDDPKFGQWDEKNEAHVGGSNWAGGTGGSNTAGLGGRGGPYRLDRGHKVHQVSDAAKAEVSEEQQRVAREMAEKAFQDKLKEIEMGEGEYAMYDGLVNPIRGDIAALRQGLGSVEARKAERGWLKRQSFGELDDNKLVDGVTGEKFVYKRRGIPDEASTHMKHPKRVRFVFDCSGSMYRFNGQDGRLDRSLEAAALVMEAFAGHEHRFDYSIVGHSGDSPAIPLVNFGEHPKTEADRMKVLRMMVAHTQFTRSGDHTLESIAQAKIDVAEGAENADEYIVIAISDANLRRYGLTPDMLKRVVEGKKKGGSSVDVRTYAIMIASLGSEADEIKRSLASKAFVCKDTGLLPKVIRDVLSKIGE
ncbi:hypothetical protein TrLO_g11996 [Triparma laevis f. longispina]|uniref:VWFA domain-containing protein n=1 Tax=Triparma laevis f. longispina TaxID=1714387 RepID=A0A9W7CI54_9STRA|nr:hypothetical protein TrLO_g11996 [Triparma laevis f. longispina]